MHNRKTVLLAFVLTGVVLLCMTKWSNAAENAAGLSPDDPQAGLGARATPPSSNRFNFVVPAPTASNRVTADARFHPNPVQPGGVVSLLVKARVAPGHYIYPLGGSGTKLQATVLEVEQGDMLQPDGSWRGPQSKLTDIGSNVLRGELLFERRFRIQSTGPFSGRIPLTLKYQVCNESVCWPPANIRLEVDLKVLDSK